MAEKIMRGRGYVRSYTAPYIMDNLGQTIKMYDPEKWRAKRYESRSNRAYPKIQPPDYVEFVVTCDPDPDADWSWCGEFTDKWEPGAIFHSRDPRLYKYFVPENKVEDHFKWYHEHGYSRQVAWEISQSHVRQDYRTMLEECQYTVCVTLKISDQEIDQEFLGGVFLDNRGNVPADTVEEMKQELIHKHKDLLFPAYGYA